MQLPTKIIKIQCKDFYGYLDSDDIRWIRVEHFKDVSLYMITIFYKNDDQHTTIGSKFDGLTKEELDKFEQQLGVNITKENTELVFMNKFIKAEDKDFHHG